MVHGSQDKNNDFTSFHPKVIYRSSDPINFNYDEYFKPQRCCCGLFKSMAYWDPSFYIRLQRVISLAESLGWVSHLGPGQGTVHGGRVLQREAMNN